jgi:hypothetical protein
MRLRAEDMFGPATDPFDPAIDGSGCDREIVVWVDADADLVALLNARNGDWPRLERLSLVEARIERDRMILESAARLNPAWLDRPLDDDDRQERDARMAVIRPLVAACPEIFDPIRRGRLIGTARQSSGRSRNSIKKWLKSFYANGRCPNALLSRYEGCGHRRKGVVGGDWRKLGRKPIKEGMVTENVTTALIGEFKAAVERERAFAGDAFRIVGAHKRWKDEFCHEMVEIDGRFTARLRARYAEVRPANYRQFHRWYQQSGQHEVTSRTVLGEPIYEKDNRAIHSTSTFEAWSPGARFQIDATEVNFGVTSTLKRNVLLGRPYLYFVRDVFSRLICGYYLGFQPPSELTAALALMNAFTSKDELLRSFGFDPEVDRWPAHHVCAALLHDGGELRGHWGDWLSGKLSITFEQATAERGDLKGAVETLFHWSDVEWSRTTAGRVQSPRYRARGKRKEDIELAAEGRLDTIWEFERKLIEFVLNWNNNHVLTGYDADADMVAAGVPRVPLDIFEWGIPNRGAPRAFDDDYVRFRMMPRAKATVHPEGIQFQGIFFTSPELQPLQAEAARSGRGQPVEISHDLTGRRVLWHSSDAPHGYIVCGRADSHRWVEDLRMEEVAAIDEDREVREAPRRVEEDRARAERAAMRRESDALRAPVRSAASMTKAEAKAAKASARREERESDLKTAFGKHRPPSPGPTASGGTAAILPFRPKPSYSPPSLDEVEDA